VILDREVLEVTRRSHCHHLRSDWIRRYWRSPGGHTATTSDDTTQMRLDMEVLEVARRSHCHHL